MQALYEAVRSGNTAQVEDLVAANPKLAVFAAALLDDGSELETILAANRSLLSATSTDGWTPLHLAAHFGCEDSVRSLLNKGAEVNARSSNPLRNMPLHAAAAGGSAAVVKLLIERGANVDARQHGGWTPLHAAAQSGNLEMAKVLVESGADVNVRADNHQRPLDLALTKGQQKMVEYLESQGAVL
jgi:ankyrin repeat protein